MVFFSSWCGASIVCFGCDLLQHYGKQHACDAAGLAQGVLRALLKGAQTHDYSTKAGPQTSTDTETPPTAPCLD